MPGLSTNRAAITAELCTFPELTDAPGEEGAPVRRVTTPTGDQLWLVTSYALGRTVLSDPRLSRAAAVARGAPRLSDTAPAPSAMTSMDGPEHARIRRIVAGAFTTRCAEALRPLVERLTDELLDGLATQGPPADFVAHVAAPLPLAVLCRLLGIPDEDRDQFRSSVGVLFDITARPSAEKTRQRLMLVYYMTTLIERKRRCPDDSLMSTLIRTRDSEGALSEHELVNLGLALLMAGYETTVGQIGLTALALLTDHDHRRTLRSRSAWTPAAVDEYLRLVPATPLSFPRVALQDVPLGPVTVRAGEAAVVSLANANTDPTVFPDPVASLETRPPHLTFGHGAHRCLGAHLARLQVSTAIGRALGRFPELRLAAGDASVRWTRGLATRGLTRLIVTW
ncbi:cytochrome P450 [Streptomyces lunalinharesii]|uniref:Cytochrome P450 n=1 Tax=Streptomyces lunalinharesii TaxID=333384 RepID=A0ABN3SM09_9ACTN